MTPPSQSECQLRVALERIVDPMQTQSGDAKEEVARVALTTGHCSAVEALSAIDRKLREVYDEDGLTKPEATVDKAIGEVFLILGDALGSAWRYRGLLND